ncbi:hypothetical protein APSETT445_006106 [Aspergillus pseudonomiae]
MTVSNETKKPYFGLTGGWLTFWVTVACATDMSLFGYDQGVFSGVVITRDFLEVHDLVGPEKTTSLSTVTAIYDVGCFFGAIVAFTIGEQLGRKKAILLGTTIMAVGAVLQAASFGLAQMFVGRIVLGIGNGINTATAPIWQTETSQLKWRGKLVIFEMMMNIFGFCLVNWINYGLSFVGGSIAWRFPLAFQFFFLIILWSTTPWLPESPRWLIAHGRQEEATVVLSCLEAKPIDDPFVIAQRNEIEYSVRYERENSTRWRDLWKTKENDSKTLRRLLLGAGSQFMQQFGGINIMSYYLPTVLMDSVGLSDTMARLLAACNALSYLVFSGLAVLLVERMGRRGLMLLSTFGQFFCFLVITILLRFSRISDNGDKYASASVAFFFLYYGAFGIGMLGVPWLYPTEINSLPMRTKGAAVATATDWITNFVVVEITPIGIKNIDWKFWIVWTVTNAAFLPILYFLYPETAKVAGVKHVIGCTPPINGEIPHSTIAAMHLAGADEIFLLGGVQAVAAMAVGTETIRKVDFLAGPGNRFVAEGKRQLFGEVGIDLFAGPTEILILSDETADPFTVATDLISQAEHGPDTPAVLITTCPKVGRETIEIVNKLLSASDLSTADVAKVSWDAFGEVIVVDTMEELWELGDHYASEHVQVFTKNPRDALEKMSNYGALFLGENTCVSYGDKVIGTNHVLPTRTTARYTGGLWVGKYLKTCTYQEVTSSEASGKLGRLCGRAARAERFEAHARSGDLRANRHMGDEIEWIKKV